MKQCCTRTCSNSFSYLRFTCLLNLFDVDISLPLQGISGVRDAAEYMKDQAKHFQIDTDKFDVVRLALKAANMARNNSFARRPGKFFCRKPTKPVDLDVAVEDASEAKVMDSAPPDICIPDYIPPSGGSPFKSMDVLSKQTAEEGALCCTSFATVSDSSPDELKPSAVSWNEGQEGGDIDTQEPEPSEDQNGGALTSSHKSDQSNELVKSSGELEYEEAAHYANDVVTARALFQGRTAPNVNPLDSYFKAVLRTFENCTAPLHSIETPLPEPVAETSAADDDFVTVPDVENSVP